MIDLIPNKHRYTSSFPKLTMLLEEELDLLTFIAEEDGVTFGFERIGHTTPFVTYSVDNGNSWIELKEGEQTIPINKSLKLMWRGDASFYVESAVCGYYGEGLHFMSSGLFSASGSIKLSFNKKINNLTENSKKALLNMGLPEDVIMWYLDNIYASNSFLEDLQNNMKDSPDSEFESLGVSREEAVTVVVVAHVTISYASTFANANLLSTKNLKMDALCYTEMFYNSSIVEAPDVVEVSSITDLNQVFLGCTNLEKAPVIQGIFKQITAWRMFYNCPKLNYVKVIGEVNNAATTFANFLYEVAPEGVVESNLDIPVPEGWTLKKVEK